MGLSVSPPISKQIAFVLERMSSWKLAGIVQPCMLALYINVNQCPLVTDFITCGLDGVFNYYQACSFGDDRSSRKPHTL